MVSWNNLEDTQACLTSLEDVDYPNFEVIVVDNGSTGNDAELLKKQWGHLAINIHPWGEEVVMIATKGETVREDVRPSAQARNPVGSHDEGWRRAQNADRPNTSQC